MTLLLVYGHSNRSLFSLPLLDGADSTCWLDAYTLAKNLGQAATLFGQACKPVHYHGICKDHCEVTFAD